MSMHVTQTKKNNIPSSINGYSITISTTYYSHNKEDIDKLCSMIPDGMLCWDMDDAMLNKLFGNIKRNGGTL